MNIDAAYLVYCTPFIFIALSRIYMLKYNRLMGSGKVPNIVSAKQKQNLFLFLAVLSTMIIFIYGITRSQLI
jgi:hypothetical protein